MSDRTCGVSGCGRKHYARGLCNGHYIRLTRTGSVGDAPLQTRDAQRGCSFEGCAKPHKAGGLCDGHRIQRDAGKELTPLRRQRNGQARDALGRKQCNRCDSWLDVSEFGSSSKTEDRLNWYCRRCMWDQDLRIRYGISADTYERLEYEQGGSCAICDNPCSSGKRMAVDHDHSCCSGKRSCGRCVRGLLCAACNQGLGHFKDRIDLLESAAAYLRSQEPREGGA